MSPHVFAITAFGLTTRNPERLAAFYRGLGFTLAPSERIPEAEIALLGLSGGGMRLPLRLGKSSVTLDFFDRPGRDYPSNATAADLCFQHFALVTADAGAAWTHARKLGATAISRHGPVTLPKTSGEVTACKFRDPDGHPLEFLQFPARSRVDWPGADLVDIDHSAISVSSADVSKRFYEALGWSVQGPTLNRGETQEALDGLSEPVVEVVPMMPAQKNPHLELLVYRSPVGRSDSSDAANDVAATRTVLASDRDELIRDPDGHLLVLRKRRDFQ